MARLGQKPSTNTVESRLMADKMILITFATMATIAIVVSSVAFAISQDASAITVTAGFFGGLALAFVIAGIPCYLRYEKAGLTPRKAIRLRLVAFSVALAVLFTAVTAVTYTLTPENVILPEIEGAGTALIGVLLLVLLFIVFFTICYVALILAFGLVGVMAAIERRITPWILVKIVESGGKKNLSWTDKAVRWLFDVPEVLDASTLAIKEQPQRTVILWKDMIRPVALQLFFGLVLGIYVSLNPFISDRSPEGLVAIFSMLSNVALVIPVIVLPWFIFEKLGASIKGQTKEFTLYNGIKARIFQSYFAVGTIVIIVRLSISEISAMDYVSGFVSFMIILFLASLLCTFVYLNYFENALAEDVSREFLRRMSEEERDGNAEAP